MDDSGGSESSDVNAALDARDAAPRRSARKRRPRDDGGVPEVTHVTEEMSRQVGGALEHPDKCKARTWQSRGPCPGAQCNHKPAEGSEFCRRHGGGKWEAHGRIDCVLSLELYKKFHRVWRERQSGGQSKKRGKHWYTRHHMWMSAVNVRERSMSSRPDLNLKPLDYLEDLLDDLECPERREALGGHGALLEASIKA